VIVEVLAGFRENNDSRFVRDGARIAAELGRIGKGLHCSDFKAVVEGCPFPWSWPEVPRTRISWMSRSPAGRDGVAGFAFGRNISRTRTPQPSSPPGRNSQGMKAVENREFLYKHTPSVLSGL
jgi:hypothetical protein